MNNDVITCNNHSSRPSEDMLQRIGLVSLGSNEVRNENVSNMLLLFFVVVVVFCIIFNYYRKLSCIK